VKLLSPVIPAGADHRAVICAVEGKPQIKEHEHGSKSSTAFEKTGD
jgi:hypothetical protein